MLDDNNYPIRITLAGHTNVGKSTLCKTLTKSDSGKIGDGSGTTEKVNEIVPKSRKSLQAIFVDCPGFQHIDYMTQYVHYQNFDIESLPGFEKYLDTKGKDIAHDKKAYKAIKESEIVLYVGDLSVTPDNGHLGEIKLIKDIQSNVIGILNKGTAIKDNKLKKRRIKQWTAAFNNLSVEQVFDFDAHWDSSSKITKIYQAIEKKLPLERREIFKKILKKYHARQKKINQKAFKLLCKAMKNIREYKSLEADEHDYEKPKKKLKNKIHKKLKKTIDEFESEVVKLYETAAKFPDKDPEDFPPDSETDKVPPYRGKGENRVPDFLGDAGKLLRLFNFIFPGKTEIEKVLDGVKLGRSLIRKKGGNSSSDEVERYEVYLPKKTLKRISEYFFALIYVLYHHGYGGNRKIKRERLDQVLFYVADFNKNSKTNWGKAKKETVYEWCQKTLKSIDL